MGIPLMTQACSFGLVANDRTISPTVVSGTVNTTRDSIVAKATTNKVAASPAEAASDLDLSDMLSKHLVTQPDGVTLENVAG